MFEDVRALRGAIESVPVASVTHSKRAGGLAETGQGEPKFERGYDVHIDVFEMVIVIAL